ncbi:MAG: carbohydrate binding family 9 domain-containing protein [Chitinophagaceae bacterium]|nr:carbohydrate binding family 9 domain-containing protein [Chitinophagaceae bacterium]
MLKILFVITVLLSAGFISTAQVKTIQAIKIFTPPRIDGSLDEDIWQSVPAAKDFITNTPIYGKPSVFKTEVKIMYDNNAIYIGAYIYDDPAMIRKQFTPRDQERQSDVDYFSVFIDTYKDRQNAYQFLVTSRNVQSDARVSPNIEPNFGIYGDLSWDAVWDSKVSFKKDGWIVEMKIPFFSIRFSRDDIQDWGIQFLRFARRANESSFWNAVDPNVNGFVNQYGDLTGLQKLVPPLRLSFSPYVSGGYRGTPQIKEGYRNEWLKSGGMDVKYGISESFTLDATLIPDFGQVISDNVVNNISPFEIQFRENRPFFTEGTELFNKSEMFYSRRIGRTPEKYELLIDETRYGGLTEYDIIKNPSVTRLYNAIKLSGRTRNNLGIGIFNAVGQSERGRLRNRITGRDTSIISEQLTNYNVFVLDQALKNRSYITFTNTNVMRNGHARDANATGLDIVLYDKKNRYGMYLKPRYSKIFDSAGGYEGFKNSFAIGKVSGKLQYFFSNEFQTQKYDPNDLGFLISPNEVVNDIEVSYNIFQPTKLFLNQKYEIGVEQTYLYKPFAYEKTLIRASSLWIFKNFSDLKLEALIAPVWHNDFFELQTPQDILATPRKKIRRPPYYSFFVTGSSDSRKRLFSRWSIGAAEGPLPNDPYYKVEAGIRFRFSDRLSMEAEYARNYDNGQYGYAFFRDGVTNEPVVARRKYADVTTLFSGIYNFTARMNVTFRARHYWNRISNTNLFNVQPDGNWVERTDLNPSDYNVNYNAFNLDVFYTWDFRLGSRIIIGWKNWLGRDYENDINGITYSKYLNNAERVAATPHGNEITVRFIYFLDYMQFAGSKRE